MFVFYTHFKINGQNFTIFSSKLLRLIDLLTFFSYEKKLLIFEYNGKICNNEKSFKLILKNKSSLEIITIVGGG